MNDPLSDARPVSYWHEKHSLAASTEALTGTHQVDLLVVGSGFTGLWAALTAQQSGRQVLLIDSEHVGFGASGRNGGFVSDSLTHGLAHGLQHWPNELDQLLQLGRDNVRGFAADLLTEGIDADLRLIGKTVVATRRHEVDGLAPFASLQQEHGEDVELLDVDKLRSDIVSPTYLGGLRVRSGGGLLDPGALATGLRDAALRAGVELHEGTRVTGLQSSARGVTVRTEHGTVRADQVVLATNAYRPVARRLRKYVVPVYDHALVTEPLSASQWESIGWTERQGVTDLGNQFHYYRPTPDGRILWGGYDAVYYFGSDTSAGREQRDVSHRLLARQFLETFPQLEGLAFSHRWAGLIDTSSRFVPYVDTDRHRRVAHALGFTGLGVASSRFAARLTLDLLAGRGGLPAYSARPVPFPPEPIRYPLVQATRAALAREDTTGRRGPWLRLLDRLGVGFNS